MPSLNKRRGVLIAGNWKMYKTLSEASNLAEEIGRGLPADDEPQVALFPPAVALSVVSERAAGAKKKMLLGAQNIHFEKEGAFTGEISAEMVLSAGGKAVLCGHSERRHTFGESDKTVGRKVARALEAGLTPVLCVGEKLQEREEGRTMDVVSRQLAAGLQEVADASLLSRVVAAYEPVWAIGTGRTATPAQGQEVHHFLRSELQKRLSNQQAEETLILYGGSVKPDNAAELLAEEDIDGLLVGGASLKADSFLKICQAGVQAIINRQ
jgi:triosephosphate isomerase